LSTLKLRQNPMLLSIKRNHINHIKSSNPAKRDWTRFRYIQINVRRGLSEVLTKALAPAQAPQPQRPGSLSLIFEETASFGFFSQTNINPLTAAANGFPQEKGQFAARGPLHRDRRSRPGEGRRSERPRLEPEGTGGAHVAQPGGLKQVRGDAGSRPRQEAPPGQARRAPLLAERPAAAEQEEDGAGESGRSEQGERTEGSAPALAREGAPAAAGVRLAFKELGGRCKFMA